MNKFQLEDRLVDFAVLVIEIVNDLPDTKAGNHLAGQLAQSGESRKDFIHKIKVVLKELRETFIGLKIIIKAGLYKSEKKIQTALKENDELISIFVKSVETAQRNLDK